MRDEGLMNPDLFYAEAKYYLLLNEPQNAQKSIENALSNGSNSRINRNIIRLGPFSIIIVQNDENVAHGQFQDKNGHRKLIFL